MADTEKITINMPVVELGKIDLLVGEGLYSNRTDFIRSAIRSQLEKHAFEIQQSVQRHSYVIGVLTYNCADLEKRKAKGEKLNLSVVGVLRLDDDISPDLALEVISSIRIYGIFSAKDSLKAALAGRMK